MTCVFSTHSKVIFGGGGERERERLKSSADDFQCGKNEHEELQKSLVVLSD